MKLKTVFPFSLCLANHFVSQQWHTLALSLEVPNDINTSNIGWALHLQYPV